MPYIALLLIAIALFAMPAWMAHCKKQNRKHYLLHWLASLVPVGLYVLMMAVNPNLASHTLIQALVTLPAVMSGTAFLSGLLYLLSCIFSKTVVNNTSYKKAFNKSKTTSRNIKTNTDIWGRKFWRNDDFWGRDFWQNNDFWGK